jgi:hypothetical protein
MDNDPKQYIEILTNILLILIKGHLFQILN